MFYNIIFRTDSNEFSIFNCKCLRLTKLIINGIHIGIVHNQIDLNVFLARKH